MAVTGYVIPCLGFALNMVDHVISRCLFHLKNRQPCYTIVSVAAYSILYMAIVSMIIHGSQSPYVGNFVHGRPWSNLCH